ncbi:hypothetical protein Droror1_Dr00002800 [Drosera rotundifolia]
MPTPSTTTPSLATLLAAARPFLNATPSPTISTLIAVLGAVGAGECWHKHGSFLAHLVDIHRILSLWNSPDAVSLCGLFHSAYSNSYVNLAIFDPHTGRDVVRSHVGDEAERLIHLFCVVPRQRIIHDDLLFRYTDEELVDHLAKSERSVREMEVNGRSEREEKWRVKIREILPEEGIVVDHIKTGEKVPVSRRVMAVFLMMTMADFSDQLFGFQDQLFNNDDGRLEFTGNNFTALWPGNGKPGLWMNSISRMGAIYTLIIREEALFISERKRASGDDVDHQRDEDIELVDPPVFDGCTKVLGTTEQREARDLYWEAVSSDQGMTLDKAEELLLRAIEKNPFIGEPNVVLAQVYLLRGRYEEAAVVAERGVRLLLEWGSPWDKRTSWEGWISWGRVLLMKAKERDWPQSSWGILNLGLVK